MKGTKKGKKPAPKKKARKPAGSDSDDFSESESEM